MKLGAHDVVVVACEDADAVSRLPVPNANCLIVGTTDDPRILMMEEGGSDIIQMTEKSKNTSAQFVVPNL